jgi:hypothetical protein
MQNAAEFLELNRKIQELPSEQRAVILQYVLAKQEPLVKAITAGKIVAVEMLPPSADAK